MSQPILYDSLLVHYLARELHGRLRGTRLRRVRFDSDARRFTLELDRERLVWELHASRGWIRRVEDGTGPGQGEAGDGGQEAAGEAGAGDGDPREASEGWGGRRIRTQRRPRVRSVTAPADERLLEIAIDAGGPDRASRFVVELMTNQWNVLALDPEGRIVSALWTRETGGRSLRSGEPYRPPDGGDPREGLETPVSAARFREVLAGSGPETDAPETDHPDPGPRPEEDLESARRGLVRALAWTSPLSARSILPDGADPLDPVDVEAAYARYAALASRPDPAPRVLEARDGLPYPLPLPGVADEPTETLLDAFEVVATREAPAGLAPEVRSALETRRERAARRAAALGRELESAPETAVELRRTANLLMARLHQVPKGASEVELEDFEGGTVTVELDPKRSPVENAESLYDQAGRRERAAKRLPARVREAESEARALGALLEALDAGEADPAEVARWVEEVKPSSGGGGGDETRLPYRSFRSSGGLEIRVGRSGKANDALTFHHSAPDDIWLHARDVAGAHVILRWGKRDQNPPKRDLLEAAVLAALGSKARSSGTVPVDWTRRKYVRSPRNAPPGAVIPDRVETVFVAPDPAVEERLAE